MRKMPDKEASLSLVSIWWAIILFVNDDMFINLPSIFAYVTSFSTQTTWGIIFIIAALIKVIGLITERKYLRLIGLYCSLVLYGLITTGYILSSNPLISGTGVHFVLMLIAYAAIREVKQDGYN